VAEVSQHIAILYAAGLGDSEQARRSDFSLRAAVAETGLAPLHRDAQRPFGGVVGRFHARVLDKRKQLISLL